MKYLIKGGKLYQIDNGRPGTTLACLKTPYYPMKKTILSSDGRIKLYADIQRCQGGEINGERIYVISDPLDQTIISGIPIYSDNLSLLSGMTVNQIRLTMEHRLYDLFMRSSQEYCIMDENCWVAVRLEHCTENGGWSVEADPVFSPFILMGLFIFCRYLDKENEFITD